MTIEYQSQLRSAFAGMKTSQSIMATIQFSLATICHHSFTTQSSYKAQAVLDDAQNTTSTAGLPEFLVEADRAPCPP